MKLNNYLHRMVSALLTITLAVAQCPTVMAAEKQITIGTLQELETFAKNCSYDAYSKDLTVVLTDDIDLGSSELSIPIFLGTFDGNGHHIRDLKLTQSASSYGFFNRIESGAVIKNLHIDGEITPDGTQSKIGGIAGENYGTIEQCSFSGIVIGGDTVGGISGYNGDSGMISECSVFGGIRGISYTGGIVGQNTGALLQCSNAAAVNTIVNEDEENLDTGNLENTIYRILKRETVTEHALTTDIGGIVGYSTGAIQSCTNKGDVGYSHVGYNVGGIAGRQNGYLANCTNHGTIQGRKDVGGIVGQMTPDIVLQTSDNSLDDLQNELNLLQSQISRSMDDVQDVSDTISESVERLSDYTDFARASAHSLGEQTVDFADENLMTLNRLLLMVERYLSKLNPILDDLDASSNSISKVIADIKEFIGKLDDSTQYNDQALAQLKRFETELNAACQDILDALEVWRHAFTLTETDSIPDTQTLQSAVTQLEDCLSEFSAELEQRIVNSDTVTQILDEFLTVNRELASLLKHSDYSALRSLNTSGIQSVLPNLQQAAEAFSSAFSHLKQALDALHQFFQVLSGLNGTIQPLFPKLDISFNNIKDSVLSFSKAMSQMGQWARNLAGEDIDRFVPFGNDFEDTSNDLNDSLNGISNELWILNQDLSDTNSSFLTDLRTINTQFTKVINLFFDMLTDTKNWDYDDIFEDISEVSLQTATRGKALECTNYGKVLGDRNAGGIAGSMAIEYDLDPEDDLHSDENRSLRFTYQTQAILMSCNNYGAVQAKKSCAGGVIGRMDIGTVYQCGSWDSVSSKSGDYVGGIAGLSLSSIRESYAKCFLAGNKYVGGIAGSGKRISDCIAMVNAADYVQFGGAIAGEVTDSYKNNCFVADTLAGVDRISLAGKAEKLSYPELCQKETIPDDFRHLILKFVYDDNTLKTVKFTYGDSFTSDIYPDTAADPECYIHWDNTNLRQLHYDTTVTAESVPYITTLASDFMADGHPVLLAEGLFREGDHLELTAASAPKSISAKVLETWSVTLPDDEQETHLIRWRDSTGGKKKLSIYLKQDTDWEKVSYEKIGSYLCFEMNGNTEFAVTSSIFQ